MDKAIENIKQLLGKQSALRSQKWFERVQKISKANRVFRHVASTKDKEQLADYLAEVRYALIFLGLGFEIEFEPAGNQGPDLGIVRDNHRAMVEIMRFRRIHSGLPLLNLDDEDLILPEYGNPPRDIQKAFEKILAKFPQIEGRQGIIAIWNDDEELEDIETEIAVHNIRADVSKGSLSIPDGLLFALYGSKWIGDKQLYCFPFRRLEQPFETWKAELEMATVFCHIKRAFLPGQNPHTTKAS
jgi:hypothetical protein